MICISTEQGIFNQSIYILIIKEALYVRHGNKCSGKAYSGKGAYP